MITKGAFLGLQAGDIIIDGEGNRWPVLQNRPYEESTDFEFPGCDLIITLRKPDGRDPLEVGWIGGSIYDDDAAVPELNHPNTTIKKKSP